jgi:hypothetical protein
LKKGEIAMTEPKILAQDEQDNRRLVELEAIHEVDRDGSLSLLYTASMTEGGVTLRRISSHEPSTQFYLDINVMEALVAGWVKFQADNEARAIAKEEHEQAIVKEAYELAARYPEIAIEDDGTASSGWWRVSIPSQGYTFMHPAYYPQNLMEQVKICAGVLAEQKRIAGGDAA